MTLAYIILLTGGQRSGKSSYAQRLAEEKSASPVYLATARHWDDDFKNRIAFHKKERGKNWTTVEEEKNLSAVQLENKTVVLDCITLWLTNIFTDLHFDVVQSLDFAKKEWDKLISTQCTLIVVSNEVGMGIHAESESARKFADLQGWVNQYIAKSANQVYLMVSGIAVKIK